MSWILLLIAALAIILIAIGLKRASNDAAARERLLREREEKRSRVMVWTPRLVDQLELLEAATHVPARLVATRRAIFRPRRAAVERIDAAVVELVLSRIDLDTKVVQDIQTLRGFLEALDTIEREKKDLVRAANDAVRAWALGECVRAMSLAHDATLRLGHSGGADWWPGLRMGITKSTRRLEARYLHLVRGNPIRDPDAQTVFILALDDVDQLVEQAFNRLSTIVMVDDLDVTH